MKPLDDMTLEELTALSVSLTGRRVRAKADGDRETIARIRREQLEVNQQISLRSGRVEARSGKVVRPRMIK